MSFFNVRSEYKEDFAFRLLEIRRQFLNALAPFPFLQPVHDAGFEIAGWFHFVASSNSFIPRIKASGIFLTYFC